MRNGDPSTAFVSRGIQELSKPPQLPAVLPATCRWTNAGQLAKAQYEEFCYTKLPIHLRK
jgi:hypothetical protein